LYLIEKTNQYKNTIIVDEDGQPNEINLCELSWLPNSNILEINKILAKNDDERCPIIQSMSAYEPRKKWMSSKETPEFKYPCVHSTPKAKASSEYNFLLIILVMSIFGLAVDVYVVYTYFLYKI
jgi:hypothetical protein